MPGSFLSQGREAVGGDKAFKGTRNTRGYPHMVNLQAGIAHWVGVHSRHNTGAKLL